MGVLGTPEGWQSRLSLLERGVTMARGAVGAELGVWETACPRAAELDEIVGGRTRRTGRGHEHCYRE